MPLIIVGGQAKDVGKTTLVCNIIATFPQSRWTAVKFTSHSHLPENSQPLVQTRDYAIWQQSSPGSESDTARYLSAGAERALLIQVSEGRLKEACLAVQQDVSLGDSVLAESSGAAKFLSPDLYLMLLDSAKADFKDSAREIEHVDGVVSKEARGPAGSKPSYRYMRDGLDPALSAVVANVLAGRR